MIHAEKTKAFQHAENSIHQLASNSTQGSLDLTISAVHIIQQYLDTATHHSLNTYKTSILQLLKQIKSAQPSMAYIITYVDDVSTLLQQSLLSSVSEINTMITQFHETFLEDLTNAPYQMVTHIDSLIPPQAIIATFSNSSTISIILNLLKQQRNDFIVYCSEARPKQEGTILSETLCKTGIPTVLMTDAELFSSVEETTAVLIGADAICSKGIINKMGTKPLATIAYLNHIPVYVACHDEKILSYDTKIPAIHNHKPEEILSKNPAHLSIRNHYFDNTPFSVITSVITQSTVYTTNDLVLKMKTT